MKILIATHNKQKLIRYKRLLSGFTGLELFSLDDVGISDSAEENSTDNMENAKHKAQFYGDLSRMVTIAIDEAVMTNFLPENEQPGVYVRRMTADKKELSDAAIVEIWKRTFTRYPQKDKRFIWDFAIAFYNPENGSMDFVRVAQISYVAGKVSDLEADGYPLSRVLSPVPDGLPYTETSQEDNRQHDDINFEPFINKFRKWLTERAGVGTAYPNSIA